MITRELIIETASKSFIVNGVKSVTIDKIVKELHTSKRTLYTHFKDKVELLGACLEDYNKKVKAENEAIIESADNVIEAMAKLHHQIVRRSYEVNPNFFQDVQAFYPTVLNDSYRNTGKYAHAQLIKLATWGIEEGIFRSDLDIEVVGQTVLVMQKLLKDKTKFPISEFSIERLTFGTLVPYLRGNCTLKGREILEIQEELFKVSI